MVYNQERYEDRLDGPLKSFPFITQTSQTTSMPATTTEDEIVAELDEPPENPHKLGIKTDFHRSTVRPATVRKESLLTRALLSSPDSDTFRPEVHVVTDLQRRRSTHSNSSTASSVELTSDGDLTSPARTNTPSPPYPSTLLQHKASFNLVAKSNLPVLHPVARQDVQEAVTGEPTRNVSAPVKIETTVETLTKKRCITFACGGQKPVPTSPVKLNVPATPIEEKKAPSMSENNAVPQKRACAIKFACPATVKQAVQVAQPAKPAETSRRQSSRSPTLVRKTRTTQSPRPTSRPSSNLQRRASQSPLATRRKRPAFLSSNTCGPSSEATRFHEFASEVVEEDDWIRRDSSDNKKKITINDTLKKENAIRQLGKEAEEEALQEEEDDEQDEDEDEDDDDHPEDSDGEEHEDNSDEGSDAEASDGNETDNEAGFADSDDDSDGDEYQFWAPGRPINSSTPREASTYRASAHRTTSESSIDSPRHMSPPVTWSDAIVQMRPKPTRRAKIRPGTPDLPDSTDFVCGTLDEDRPLEEAYLSCMEVRKRERHRAIPQDIDPSFPTSDPEDDDDEGEDLARNDSDEPVWIHGKFEESDDHDSTYRRSRTRRSPLQSPKRMHSPPPQKQRLRSPAPRRLFGGTSPRRMRSPPLARQVESPTASPTYHTASEAITFTPLGQRPGLTHTKSLPRAPNAFCKQYRAARLLTANADIEEETTDGYTRGAIDIVKGLERKRQHRREKLLRKQNNRARKSGLERKPQPGKGAERMRELGLHMAGKGGAGKAAYVLSV